MGGDPVEVEHLTHWQDIDGELLEGDVGYFAVCHFFGQS